MPRPKRARRAPNDAKAPEPLSDTDHLEQDGSRPRGRATRARPVGSCLSLAEEDAVCAAKRTRDAALDSLANEDSTTTGDDTIEIGRRAMATPAMRRDTTGLDLPDDVFGDLDDSFADGDIPGGGASADSSSLTLSRLKPRSRQSSFAGRNDPPIRPSSRGPNTPGLGSSNIGAFRRRPREPSILGTSQKPLSETGATAQSSEAESKGEGEGEGEGDFRPEAESTPIYSRRRTRPSLRLGRDPSSPPQSAQSGSKRKSVEPHHGSPQPDEPSCSKPAVEQDADSDSELSVLASPSPPPPGPLQRSATPVNQDEIIAPPASGNSDNVGDLWPDIHALAKRRRRPSVMTPLRGDDGLTDISSPPSLTHSPSNADRRAAKRRGRPAARCQTSPTLTTQDLVNLLPKRRRRRAQDSLGLGSDEELDATDLAHDEDELANLVTRAARSRSQQPRGRGASTWPGSRAASRARGNQPALGPKRTPASGGRSARASKMYRRRCSNKENEGDGDDEGGSAFVPLPDDTFDTGTSTGEAQGGVWSEELQRAAAYFREVDQWNLDFEDVDESPSPQDAR